MSVRVLEYNGEVIISESIERYEIIKNYIIELKTKILIDGLLFMLLNNKKIENKIII